ncbi:MAG: polysaccharide biosynthesis protein, partial [Peptostreptococcaceae bacterium]
MNTNMIKRQLILNLIDLIIIFISFILSLNLVNTTQSINSLILIPIIIYMTLNTVSFTLFKCYSSIWRYAGDREILTIILASTVYIVPMYFINNYIGFEFSKLFYILSAMFVIILSCGLRITYRLGRRMHLYSFNMKNRDRVLIIGGGYSGSTVIKETINNKSLQKEVVAIVDDDKVKLGRFINGVKVVGNLDEIEDIVNKFKIDEIIFSISNIEPKLKQTIINRCKETNCKLKTIPSIDEMIDGKVDIKKIRDVEIKDLLGREPINVDLLKMSEYIEQKTILVTGGGGSIGSELCRQIATFNPKQLIIVDNYENNAYQIQQELVRKYGSNLNLKVIIASVREIVRMEEIFKTYLPQVVFHAAAHK